MEELVGGQDVDQTGQSLKLALFAHPGGEQVEMVITGRREPAQLRASYVAATAQGRRDENNSSLDPQNTLRWIQLFRCFTDVLTKQKTSFLSEAFMKNHVFSSSHIQNTILASPIHLQFYHWASRFSEHHPTPPLPKILSIIYNIFRP
jgi:hypothetical protein